MTKLVFGPRVNVRASEYIEQKIKEAIVRRKVNRGDKLPTEKELALQFGVSVVTVREALRALETLRFIKKKKGLGGGAFVCEIDNQSIKASLGHFLSFKDLSPRHLLEVRRMIEPPIARLVAQKITQEEIVKLEENVANCESQIKQAEEPLSDKTFHDVDLKNIAFHRIIAEATHNPILSLTVDYVFDFLWECEKDILLPDVKFSVGAVNHHRAILNFIKQGDSDSCEKEMILHLKGLDEALTEMAKRVAHTDQSPRGARELQERIRMLRSNRGKEPCRRLIRKKNRG